MVPFIPIRPMKFSQFISWLHLFSDNHTAKSNVAIQTQTAVTPNAVGNWITDFSISVNKDTASFFHYLLLGIWVLGMFIMILLAVKSKLRLYHLEQSALPL